MKSKKIMQMCVPEDKMFFLMIFVFLLFSFCNDNKRVDLSLAQRIVLVDSVSAKLESRLDSIVFLYTDMKNNKMFVRQTEYFTNKQSDRKPNEPLSDAYFLFSDNKCLYVGNNFLSKDTTFFFPYCSYTLYDTVCYYIDNYSIEGLIAQYGYTVFKNQLDSNRKEYIGKLLLHPDIIVEDPTAKWVFDDSNRIESICLGQSNFVRKSNEIVKLPEKYRLSKDKFTNVFIYNDNRQKIDSLIRSRQYDVY